MLTGRMVTDQRSARSREQEILDHAHLRFLEEHRCMANVRHLDEFRLRPSGGHLDRRGMQDDVLIKRAAILELFGYRDLSVCLMESFFQGSVEKRNAILEQFFKNAQSESSLVEKVQRKLSVLLGKKRSIHAPIHD